MVLTLETIRVIALLCHLNGVTPVEELKCQKYYVQCVKNAPLPSWHSGSQGELLQECILNKTS